MTDQGRRHERQRLTSEQYDPIAEALEQHAAKLDALEQAHPGILDRWALLRRRRDEEEGL